MDKYEKFPLIPLIEQYGPKIDLHEPLIIGPEGRLVLDLVGRWGMVAADDGGEDSSGRAKLRLATPEEMVARAVETSRRVFAAIREEGWFTDVSPQIEEIRQRALQKEQERNR